MHLIALLWGEEGDMRNKGGTSRGIPHPEFIGKKYCKRRPCATCLADNSSWLSLLMLHLIQNLKRLKIFHNYAFILLNVLKPKKEELLQLFIHCPLNFSEKEDLKAYLAACFCAGTLKYLSSDISKPNNAESLLLFIPAKD